MDVRKLGIATACQDIGDESGSLCCRRPHKFCATNIDERLMHRP